MSPNKREKGFSFIHLRAEKRNCVAAISILKTALKSKTQKHVYIETGQSLFTFQFWPRNSAIIHVYMKIEWGNIICKILEK